MSIVEESLRAQPRLWREISRKATEVHSELPLEHAKRILLFGVGSSHFAARLTGLALQKGQKLPRAQIVACSSTQILGGEISPQRGDWAFAFSHRGRTPATLQALDQCQQAGAFGILVAGEGAPNEVARQRLVTSPIERVEPHTMAVTGAIAAVTSLLLGGSVLEEWDYLATRCADFDLERLRERAGKGPSVILGEWEGEWIAREGALKLMEMAALPVRAFGSEEFFHGPRHSVKSGRDGDAIWYCETHRDPRGQELAPALTVSVSTSTPISWVPALV